MLSFRFFALVTHGLEPPHHQGFEA